MEAVRGWVWIFSGIAHLGVLFTQDHLNGTKIYLPSGSKFLVKRVKILNCSI